MKKKLLVLTVVVLVFAAAALATGGFETGGPAADSATPNARVPSLLVNGVLYQISPDPDDYLQTEPGTADYLGSVSTRVPLSQMPTRDGESNTHAVGTPYVACEQGIAVQEEGGGWRVFVPADKTEN